MNSMYFKTLPEKYKVYKICHDYKLEENSILLDVRDLNLLNRTINMKNPDIIINSVGILNDLKDWMIKNKQLYSQYYFK
ncbi:MAG: hypothetical protein MUO60_03305 [Clostridiaceae bacterium]|nr:hypothetical protein [Clostridiaceae bacterium]